MNWNTAIKSNWKHFQTLLVLAGIKVFLLDSILSYRSSNRQHSSQPSKTADWLVDDIADVDWSTVDADHLTPEQILDYFAWPNASSCRSTRHFGGVSVDHFGFPGLDGQKAVCMDAQVVPAADSCLVYSFGIGLNSSWSFEDAMADYGCHVFSFDASINEKDHDRSKRVHFFNTALHTTDTEMTVFINTSASEKWKMRTLSSIHESLMSRHGHAIIDYLKLDVLGNEWNVLPQIIQSGILSKVRQLTIKTVLKREESLRGFRKQVRMLQTIEKDGMVRFHSRALVWYVKYVPALGVRTNSNFEIAWYNSRLERKI